MKIGILSMQRVYNYGSFLQAFALKRIVESLGHTVGFLDIRRGKPIVSKVSIQRTRQNRLIHLLGKCDNRIISRIGHCCYMAKFRRMFQHSFRLLGLPRERTTYDRLDIVVIGSDEVFNCTQGSDYGFSAQLFGEGIDAKSVISYAASCGFTTMDRLTEFGLCDQVREALRNIKAISVRDDNTKQVIAALTGIEPHVHIDPTLLYDFEDDLDTVKPCEYRDFILVYGYCNRINDRDEVAAIRRFAAKHHKKLLAVGLYQDWCDKSILVSPLELLQFYKAADYVVTDTFHGTVFSIKYNKQFCSLVRHSNTQKLSDLLAKFSLMNRAASRPTEIGRILSESIDYGWANSYIQSQRDRAIRYLSEHLS